jgi:protein SCO1/2
MDSRQQLRQRSLWVVLVVVLVALGAIALYQWQNERKYVRLDDFGAVPAFTLQNMRGETVTRDSLAGHIWIADLFFTRCTTVCPVMSNKMRSLQSALADQPDIYLVSFSADPTHDTPDALATYATRYKANPKQWFFLTGPVETIYQISKNGFHLAIDSVGGDQTPPIVHSTRFVLVDKHGHIRGYFDGSAQDAVKIVTTAVESLQHEE